MSRRGNATETENRVSSTQAGGREEREMIANGYEVSLGVIQLLWNYRVVKTLWYVNKRRMRNLYEHNLSFVKKNKAQSNI